MDIALQGTRLASIYPFAAPEACANAGLNGEDCLSLTVFRRRVPQPYQCCAKTEGSSGSGVLLSLVTFFLST